MNSSTKYDWTPELANLASRAYTKATTGRMWMFLMAGLIITPAGLFDYFHNNREQSLFAVYMGVFFICLNLCVAFLRRRSIRDLASTVIVPEVQVTLSDGSLIVRIDENQSTTLWQHVTKCRRVDGFLLLFAGSVILAVLPEKFLTDEQISFIEAASARGSSTKR